MFMKQEGKKVAWNSRKTITIFTSFCAGWVKMSIIMVSLLSDEKTPLETSMQVTLRILWMHKNLHQFFPCNHLCQNITTVSSSDSASPWNSIMASSQLMDLKYQYVSFHSSTTSFLPSFFPYMYSMWIVEVSVLAFEHFNMIYYPASCSFCCLNELLLWFICLDYILQSKYFSLSCAELVSTLFLLI